MTLMIVTSSVTAETKNSLRDARNHARPRAYVALLGRGVGGQVARSFVGKARRSGSDKVFEVTVQPGDIYEIRRWFWDAARQAFMGGTVWIGIDGEGKPFGLDREEALSASASTRIASTHGLPMEARMLASMMARPYAADLRFIR